MTTIRVNGKEIEFTGKTVHDILQLYSIKPETIVVEKNGEIVHRDIFQTEPVNDGDIIEIVQFVGGG